MGRWKAVRYGIDSETELYDLDSDLYETSDVAKEHPAIVEKMNRLLKETRTETEGFPYGGKIQDYSAKEKYLKPSILK